MTNQNEDPMASKQKPKQKRPAQARPPKGPPPVVSRRMPVTVRDPLKRREVKRK